MKNLISFKYIHSTFFLHFTFEYNQSVVNIFESISLLSETKQYKYNEQERVFYLICKDTLQKKTHVFSICISVEHGITVQAGLIVKTVTMPDINISLDMMSLSHQ